MKPKPNSKDKLGILKMRKKAQKTKKLRSS